MSAEANVVDTPAEQRYTAPEGGGEQHGQGGGADTGEAGAEDGGRGSQGMGQSKSSRRRRRKRKMKAGEVGGPAAGGAEPEGDSDTRAEGPGEDQQDGGAQASSSAGNGPRRDANRQPGSQAQGGANGAGAGSAQGTKRWKKKFRERDRPRGAGEGGGNGPREGGYATGGSGGSNGFGGGGFRNADTHQPGNTVFKRKGGGGGGFAGKNRSNGSGGGSRGGFVGPMDHSYRATNGNFADGGPGAESYSPRRGGHSGDSQPIDYSQGRTVPIAPDAPTHIYFFIEDLFITAKINETARKLGVKVRFVKNDKEQVAQLLAAEENDKPSLIVFDLNNANAKPMTLMPKIKTKLKKSVSIIGFLSHLQGDLKAKAMESGCDTVMPRAAFSQNLPNLLRRYGLEETEDGANFNQ